ncbi:uncharacterized protein BO97DRAFT_440028 [Aspergillus homomorphus CBS 101889]|uniref:Uncharacterized protein n=1 Tax=Aspergillus homomorphus (strain CBS 101889) TaxID=1450537 RepID=A0A395IAP3_ASPHC|nr:hypothetical protein BO97DRAFT_440028 [Aspergillus homomorphus CBS 101889]RAL16213.1 hypothetical protein BO97DRAFT_440028 [Aspergillus homomorphus CBS 101889]
MGRSDQGGPIGAIIHGVTSGIGFATEVHSYKKTKKAARREREQQQQQQQQQEEQSEQESSHSPSQFPPPYSVTPPGDQNKTPDETTRTLSLSQSTPPATDIERTWHLDEAQELIAEETAQPRTSKQGTANPDKVIAAFLQRRLPPPDGAMHLSPVSKLTYPVAIPQRRPKDKKRGFIRAYAPDLQAVGIDQDTWLDMIETLNEASLANPWINAINLASIAAAPLPFAISTAISMAIMVATDVAIEAQSRYRQNKALDRLNQEFFQPRGLYCLVMTWDATAADDARINMNINTTVQNTMDSQGRMSHKFQSSNGVTNGMESMQTAELVFPGLDFLATATQDEQAGFKKKLARGKMFVDDYLDRKAQAKFLAENPDSYLTQAGKPKFASKYADPTHPMHSGLSGGMRGAHRQQGRGLGSRGDLIGRRIEGRRGGGGGLLGLVNMAAQAVADRGSNNNSNSNNHSNPPAPYGSSNPPAPYGGCDSAQHNTDGESRPPVAYGGSNSSYYDNYYNEYPEQQQQQQQYRRTRAGRGGGRGLNLKNLVSSKVLYLMVVNMPTEEEMAQARNLTAGWNVQRQQEHF